MTKTKSTPPDLKCEDIIKIVVKSVWEKQGNKGDPPIPTLEEMQNYTQPLAEKPFLDGDTPLYSENRKRHRDEYVAVEGNRLRVVSIERILQRGRARFKYSQKKLEAFIAQNPDARAGDIPDDVFNDPPTMQEWEENPRLSATDFPVIADYLLSTAGMPNGEKMIEWLHTQWLCAREDQPGLKHPLALLVQAWLPGQIPPTEIEKREKQIAPEFLKKSRTTPGDRLPTGFLHTQGRESAQLQLPSFDDTEDDIVVHALPLEMYQGGSGSKGAPLDERIFFNALLARPFGKPEPWNGVRLEPTLRHFVDWLWPNGWHRTNQLPLLRKALHDVHNKRISYERRDWNVVQVLAMPNKSTALDDVLPLIIRYPDGVQGNGPIIDVPRLRQYGLVSAPKWRAWIRLHYLWDTANQRNGGYKIYSTIQKVKRNDQDYLLDAQGDIILTGDPYKTNRGRWAVRKGNKPQTAWYHPQAIHIGDDRNPQCDKIPVLTDNQLTALFYDDSTVDHTARRKRLHDAIYGLMDFEEEGVVVVERDAIDKKRGVKGWRIIPVYQR